MTAQITAAEMAGAAPAFDDDRSQRFAQRMMGALNQAAVVLMVSIGHRSRLFDTMAGMAPATSAAIAETAGLDERYVREWLGGMTAARVVRYDPETRTYQLPREHAAVLTRAAGANNVALLMQHISMMG